MSALKDFEEKYNIGQAIFEQLFKLNDTELKTKLIELLDDKHNDILTNKCSCKRIIEDEKPSVITFWFYDGIRIDWQDIIMVSEHGQENLVVKFNKHFKL